MPPLSDDPARPGEPARPFGAAPIDAGRLLLTPLRQADADEMVEVLGDPRLHEFTGGRPAGRDELHTRYGRMVAGPADPDQIWLNWIARLAAGGTPVGTVQATLARRPDGWTAEVAWVIGVRWQGNGYATEAARALVDWLRAQGARSVSANIHPGHRASGLVAERAGLRRTEEVVDGEQVWRTG